MGGGGRSPRGSAGTGGGARTHLPPRGPARTRRRPRTGRAARSPPGWAERGGRGGAGPQRGSPRGGAPPPLPSAVCTRHRDGETDGRAGGRADRQTAPPPFPLPDRFGPGSPAAPGPPAPTPATRQITGHHPPAATPTPTPAAAAASSPERGAASRFRIKGRSAPQLFRGADRSGTASSAASLEKEAERRRPPARGRFPLSGVAAGGRARPEAGTGRQRGAEAGARLPEVRGCRRTGSPGGRKGGSGCASGGGRAASPSPAANPLPAEAAFPA